MIKKELYHQLILQKISLIFSELSFIGNSIKQELEKGNPNNISLKLNEVNYYLNIIDTKNKYFQNCLQNSDNWPLDKRIRHQSDTIRSFFRQFESVFFGTAKWYQRVKLLMGQLSEELRELDRLLNMNDKGEMC